MTPLEQIIAAMIRANGPMPLDRYMTLCLGHPVHGYYMTRDPFGVEGDFTTAPEISQMFGELIGVWCAGVYDAMGRPRRVNLIELGPGRGTLMADLLRAASVMPDFREAVTVHLVDTSPALRAMQAKILGSDVTWHDDLAGVPTGPQIIVANEFFDALPVRQYESRGGAWQERVAGLDDKDQLILGLVASPVAFPPAGDGTIVEVSPARDQVADSVGKRLNQHPGAALVIDYGHVRSAPGDTLQAVRRHRFENILEHPGEADLTAHVDFERLSNKLSAAGATAGKPMTQGGFLRAMGLETRAARLLANAGARQRKDIAAAVERLAHEEQMGNLFKVLAAVSPGLAIPHPFGQR